jgi:hypothetical protein
LVKHIAADHSTFSFPAVPGVLEIFRFLWRSSCMKGARAGGNKREHPQQSTRPGAQHRHSQRIVLSVSILISGERANGTQFAERTKTQVVNSQGALIQLREPVLVGQKLRMKNLTINEEMSHTVMDVDSRSAPIPEIRVAFSEACPRFWRVAFRPEDWSPPSPEAKRVTRDPSAAIPVLTKK